MSDYQILQKEAASLGIIEDELHRFTAEASSLGFPVGQWPERIETNMGNGQPFLMEREEVQDGDLLYVVYRQALGCIFLQVFND